MLTLFNTCILFPSLVARPLGESRSAARPQFIVEPLVRMADPRPRYSNPHGGASQTIRVAVPLQKRKEPASIATTAPATSTHMMASIMRAGGVLPHSAGVCLAPSTAGSAPYTSHVPRGCSSQ